MSLHSTLVSHFVHALLYVSAIPASALDEEDSDDNDEDDTMGETRDDERSGTRYNVRLS